MRTVVHLSDLHFGRLDEALLAPLLRCIHELRPHVVAVSGDLTQRARTAQFRAAREFLEALPAPRVVVPGNHDVPLYNLALRFFHPLGRFRRHVSADLEPGYVDEEVAMVGVNTARALVFKGGRINAAQMERARARLGGAPGTAVKIVVTHHPFDLPPGYERGQLVGRAAMAMRVLARCGADVLLSGHLHAAETCQTAAHYSLGGYSALVVQAGTATSTRRRGEANSFNVLTLSAPRVQVQRYVWDEAGRQFSPGPSNVFERGAAGWKSGSAIPPSL